MAKLTISSGRRGRPVSIDIDEAISQLYFKDWPKAQQRLAEFRKSTSGVRDTSWLGSETEMPKFVEAAMDVLQDLQESGGWGITYATIKQLKANLRAIRQLASKQERVFGRALDAALTADYLTSVEFHNQTASGLTRSIDARIMKNLERLTPLQRQQAMMSMGYQDPATMTGEYQAVLAWARKHTGNQELTMQEAWAVVREDRWKEQFHGMGMSWRKRFSAR